MTDYIAKIGLVLQALVLNSTVNGKDELLNICTELQSAPDTINAAVEERVRAAAEGIAGQVAVLEEGRRRADAIVFSVSNAASLGLEAPPASDEEKQRLRDLFNGADPAKFDHDGNGLPGGSAPAPAEEPAPAEPAPAEPAPVEPPAVEPAVVEPAPFNVETATAAEMRAELDSRGFDVPSKATKAEMANALNGVPPGFPEKAPSTDGAAVS